MPQAAARADRSLPVLQRKAVDAGLTRRSPQGEGGPNPIGRPGLWARVLTFRGGVLNSMSFGTGKIWMNGELVEWADAKIHVASHVVHYGSAVFEGARCYSTKQGPACFRLDAHIRRLLDSARIYRMEVPYDQPAITDAVLNLIRVNK